MNIPGSFFKSRSFFLLTLVPLNFRIEPQFNGQQGRDPALRGTPKVQVWDLAKPDETLRQKDPAPTKLWKIPSRDTDGVKLIGWAVE